MLMLEAMKRLIRKSPLGPSAVWFYRRYFREQPRRFRAESDKYDQDTFDVMRRILRPDSCCIDVGAHKGGILRAILEMSPLGTHFAFEPLPHLAAHLKRTFPTVRVYEAAVSDYAGTATFIHVENDPAYSGLRQRIYDRTDPLLQPLTVTVTRLDDVIPQEQHVSFIKLDIEGGEFHALRGAVRTIRRCRPIIVFEGGPKSTGQYGVEPEEVYHLAAAQLGCNVSVMQRWLAGQSPYSQAEFCENWRSGAEFYFIAYPAQEVVDR